MKKHTVTIDLSEDNMAADHFDYYGDYSFDTEEEASDFAEKVKSEADSYFGNDADIIEGDDDFLVSIDTHDHWSDMFYISESGHVHHR